MVTSPKRTHSKSLVNRSVQGVNKFKPVNPALKLSSYDISRVKLTKGPGSVQPKLKINQPGDKFEQEADRIADQVRSMPGSGVQ